MQQTSEEVTAVIQARDDTARSRAGAVQMLVAKKVPLW